MSLCIMAEQVKVLYLFFRIRRILLKYFLGDAQLKMLTSGFQSL